MKAKSLFIAALASLAVAVSACGGSGSAETTAVVVPAEPTPSTLTLRWTISGSTDPNACPQSVADVIDISIIDPVNGAEIAAFQQTCETFETSITLDPGTYEARARLVDAAGTPRTTDVTVPTFTLRGNDELIQDVDFPPDSFL